MLKRIPSDSPLIVLSESSAARSRLDDIGKLARENKQMIVAPLGGHAADGEFSNQIAVATPSGTIFLEKISFSDGDKDFAAKDGHSLRAGDKLHVFESEETCIAVLNCHEYTHADLLLTLQKLHPDVLIVSTRNKAGRMYDEYATADLHRLFCFIVVNNVADYGGVGAYAPFAHLKGQDGKLRLGGSLLATQGPCELSSVVPIPLKLLRSLRERWKTTPTYQAIDPPETIKFGHGNANYHREALARPVREIDLDAIGYSRKQQGVVRVAIAQMRSVPHKVYFQSSYHISYRDPATPPDRVTPCDELEARVRNELHHLERQVQVSRSGTQGVPGSEPDFLLFPEVFLPLTLDNDLAEFAQRTNTIVIGGIEYDAPQAPLNSAEARGINRARLYVPGTAANSVPDYVKLTRSRYDALYEEPDGGLKPFHMELGTELMRFKAEGIGVFGVMICYDISHFDLMHALNFGTSGQDLEPVDILFVVSHNPYAELYRKCCLADCHRFYQYVVMCNVSQYGGSGVFAPLHTKGESRTLFHVGKNAEGIFTIEIDVDGLKEARRAHQKSLKSTTVSMSARLHNDHSLQFRRAPGALTKRLNVHDPKQVNHGQC